MKSPAPESSFDLQPLEPRIMLSGDGVEQILPPVISAPLTHPQGEMPEADLLDGEGGLATSEPLIPMSGNDEFPENDAFFAGTPVNIQGSVTLVFTENSGNTFGDNTILIDTTNEGAVPAGANITISGNVNGTGVGQGGILYLNAGTGGNITINGNIGTGEAIAGIVILNANSVTIDGDVRVNFWQQNQGTGSVTFGADNTRTFRSTGGNVSIFTNNNITFNSEVVVEEGGNMTLLTDFANPATNARIEFWESVLVEEGNFTVTATKSLAFRKNVRVNGHLSQAIGTQTTRFFQDVDANSVNLRANSQIRFDRFVRLQQGDMTLTANDIKFLGGNDSVIGAVIGGVSLTNLLLRPIAPNVTMDIGSPLNSNAVFRFTGTDIGALANGFQSITFGYSSGASALVQAAQANFRDPLTIFGGSMIIPNGTLSARTSMTLNVTAGPIDVNTAILRVQNEQFDNVWGSSQLQLIAQNGNILLSNNGALEIVNQDNNSLSQGSTILLTATNGSILNQTGSEGLVQARDLVATARNHITLNTQVATLTAASTLSGHIDIFELDAIRVLSATTQNGRMKFDTGGLTRIDSARSFTDAAANTLTVDTVNGDLLIGEIRFGTLGNVTLTTEGNVRGLASTVEEHVQANRLHLDAVSGVGEAAIPLKLLVNEVRGLNRTSGAIVLRQLAGRSLLRTALRNQALTTASFFSLRVEGGNTLVDSTGIFNAGNGGIRIDTAGNLNLEAQVTGSGGPLTLLSGGAMTLAADVTATSGGGDLYLRVNGDLTMAPTAALTTAGGNLDARIEGDLQAGLFDTGNAGPQTTWGQAAILATGAIRDTSASSLPNFRANTLRLQAQTGIGLLPAPQEGTLEMDVRILAALTQSGVIVLRDLNEVTIGTTTAFTPEILQANGFRTSESTINALSEVRNSGGGDMLLSAVGAMTLQSAGNTVETIGDGIIVLEAGSIDLQGTVRSQGGDLSFSAVNDIRLRDPGRLLTTGFATIALQSTSGNLLAEADSEIHTDSGAVVLSATGNITLGRVQTANNVGLISGGSLRSAAGGNNTRTVVSANWLAISAGGGVNGPVETTEALRTQVSNLSLLGGSGPDFRIHNLGTLALDTAAATATRYDSLRTASPLSIGPNHNTLISGPGNLHIFADGGDLILAPSRRIEALSGTVSLEATGNILLDGQSLISTTSGDVQLTANGNISVYQIASLSGNIRATSATGAVFDSNPAAGQLHFATSGLLSITASLGIGFNGTALTPFRVALGTFEAVTDTGGIFIASDDGFTTQGVRTLSGSAPVSMISGGTLLVNGDTEGRAFAASGTLFLNAQGDLIQAAGTTLTAGADAVVRAVGTLRVASIHTPANLAFSAATLIGHPATTGTEISAAGLLLSSVGHAGTAAQPLRMEIDTLAGTLTGGTLAFTNLGDLTLAPVSASAITPLGTFFTPSADALAFSGTGQGLYADLAGDLTVSALPGPTLSAAAALPMRWQTAGRQTWRGTFNLAGGPVTLSAGTELLMEADGTSSTGNGSLVLRAGTALILDAATEMLTGSGDSLLQADTLLLNGALLGTGQTAALATRDLLADASGAPVRLAADALVLTAGRTAGLAGSPILTQARLISILAAEGGIAVENIGDLTVTPLGFAVPEVQLNATQTLAFSGLQAGVTALRGGTIALETSGTLTVEEVPATLTLLPGTSQAIALRADTPGPAGNSLSVVLQVVRGSTPIDASEEQDGSDLRSGDPVTTRWIPETNTLQVFVRQEVSTLAEIVAAINAEALFPAQAFLAAGLTDGSGVLNVDPAAAVDFSASGGRREGILSQRSATFAGGAEPITATVDLQPFGASYSFRFTSTQPGADANEIFIRLLDDGPGGRLTQGTNQAEIEWDASANRLNLWINFGHTTVGTLRDALIQARAVDGIPFETEIIGGFLPANENDLLGDGSVLLRSNLSPTAILRPTGAQNDFQVTANVAGTQFNGTRFDFVDVGSLPPNGATASFNGVTNVLTLSIRSGVTTANQVIAAINAEGTYSASLIQEESGGINNGNGILQAQRFLLASGAPLVQASTLMQFLGDNNDIIVSHDDVGADNNGISVDFVRDGSLALGAAAASWSAAQRRLEVRVNPSFATAGAVVQAINNLKVPGNPTAMPLTAALAPGQSGFTGITLAQYPLSAGGTSGPPRATFTATGLQNDFELVADFNLTEFENIRAFLIDDGSITNGSATAVYLPGPRHLILNVQSGVTTLNTLRAVVNAPGNGIPVSINLLPGNDGTGVFQFSPVQFVGGVDPIPAETATLLPSGETLTLISTVGGVINNGVEVSIGLDDTLAPGTAAAAFFEADGLRVLRLRAADTATSFAAIETALQTAGVPFTVAAADARTVGSLAPAFGDVDLTAGSHITLIGRIQSHTGAVRIDTTSDGDLRFDSPTARVIAMTDILVDLEGAFANLSSAEDPLLFIYEAGQIRIRTGNADTVSDEPVTLLSRGSLEITGAGLTLNNVDLQLLADNGILIDAPVDAGTGSIVLDAGDGIEITGLGALRGDGLTLSARTDILQNGDLQSRGGGDIRLTSLEGGILMGLEAETRSESGDVVYTAAGDIGVTFIGSSGSGNLILEAGGRIFDTHAVNGLNFATGGQTWLTAQTGIGAIGDGDLKTEVATLRLRNLGATGDMVITQRTGALTVLEVTQSATDGWVILNHEDGNTLFTGPVLLEGQGSLRVAGDGDLTFNSTLTLNGGLITLSAAGDLRLEADVSTLDADVALSAGGSITQLPAITVNAGGGNVLLDAGGQIVLAQLLSLGGRVRIFSLSGSILRAANDGRSNVIAEALQLHAGLAIAALNLESAALITEVSNLNAFAGQGPIALRNLGDLHIGDSTVEVAFALDTRLTESDAWTEHQFRTDLGSAVLRVEGGLTLETITPDSLPTLQTNGLTRIHVTGAADLQGDSLVTGGALHLQNLGLLNLAGDLAVSGGTLLLESAADLTQQVNSRISVDNANALLQSGGLLQVNEILTGTGALALTAAGDLLRPDGAPATQLQSALLRLQAGGAIAGTAQPLVFSTGTLTALAPNGMRLTAVGNVTVSSVSVTVNSLSSLAVAGDREAAAQADLRSSGGNILLNSTGVLTLRDGDSNQQAVVTSGAGHVVLHATGLHVYADVVTANGEITLNITGNARWFSGAEGTGRLRSTQGDLHVMVNGSLLMEDGSLIETTSGSIRLVSLGNLTLSSVQAPAGLIALNSAAAILDGGDSLVDLRAARLQMIALTGIGLLGGSFNPLNTDVRLLAARTQNGPFAMANTGTLQVGAVDGPVAMVNLSGTRSLFDVPELSGLDSAGGGSVSLTSSGNLSVLDDGTFGVRLAGSGNLLLSSTTGALSISNTITGGTGHLTLRAQQNLDLAAGVSVSTAGSGSLVLRAEAGAITQLASGTLSAENGTLHLQAQGNIGLSGLFTLGAAAVTSLGGDLLDLEPARVNLTAAQAVLFAQGSIGEGTNALDLLVQTVAGRAATGRIYLTNAAALDIGGTTATAQLAAADGSTAAFAATPRSGLLSGGTAGNLTVRTLDGDLRVLAGHAVTASQAGNLLLEAAASLDIAHAVSSGTGTITLTSGANTRVAAGILVSTGGSGQVHVLSQGGLQSEINSRFISGSGNIALTAVGPVLFGGLQTGGRAVIASQTGSILAAGSTDFSRDVLADQLIVTAALGVGRLHPESPVQAIRTTISRIAGVAGPGGINLLNNASLSVNTVNVSLSRVTASGALAVLPTVALEDLRTLSGNGSIVLRTTVGSLTLQDGANADGIAIALHGSGNLHLAAADAITLNAGVVSASGHLTFRSLNAITLNGTAAVATTGTVFLRPTAGGITMSATAAITASAMRLHGGGALVLGLLNADEVSLRSDNGGISAATGAVLNLSGGILRLESETNIGSPAAPLILNAASVTAMSRTGGIFLRALADVTVGTFSEALTVREVLTDAQTQSLEAFPSQSGLRTLANNGSIILNNTGGTTTVAPGAPVTAHGSGNVRLDAQTQLTLLSGVSSASGNLTLLGLSGLEIGANVTVQTGAPGHLLLDAGSGALTLAPSAILSAPGGSLRLRATGDILLGAVTGGNTEVVSLSGSILRHPGTTLNLTATGLRLRAAGSIGLVSDRLRIQAASLTALAETGGIFLSDSTSVSVNTVSVSINQVQTDGSITLLSGTAQSDLRTQTQGDIVLVVTGSLTLFDGNDDQLAVQAGGSGSIRLESTANLTANLGAGIRSTSGRITLRAQNNLQLTSMTLQSAADVSVRAVTGAITMNGLANATATGATLRFQAGGNITLGNLTANDLSVISDTGALVNAAGTTRNLTAQRARLQAQLGMGTASRRITAQVGTLAGLSPQGDIFITAFNGLAISSLPLAMSTTEFTAAGGTATVSDSGLTGLATVGAHDVVVVVTGPLALGLVSGATVNLTSTAAILSDGVAPLNVAANQLLLRAAGSLGADNAFLTTQVNVLAAESATGDIFIAETSAVTVGSVLDLTTPADLTDTLTGVRALDGNVFLAAAGDLTVGRVTGTLVALGTGGTLRVTPPGTAINVTATELLLAAESGIGEIGRPLRTQVGTLAAFSRNGDLLITESSALTVGSVTLPLPEGTLPLTLSGLQTLEGGDIVLNTGGSLTVAQPVISARHVRLASLSSLSLGVVSGTDVSLIASTSIQHPAGLVQADNLRARAQTALTLRSDANRISAISTQGFLTLTEATSAALASVSVTAGGVTDAAQHGLSAPLGITATALTGRFTDGGDAEADLRSQDLITLQTHTGAGSTANGLEVDAPRLLLLNTGTGSQVLNLEQATTVEGITFADSGNLFLRSSEVLTLTGTATLPLGGAFLTLGNAVLLSANLTAHGEIRILAESIELIGSATLRSLRDSVLLRSDATLTMGLNTSILSENRNVQLVAAGDILAARVTAERLLDLRSGGDLLAVSTSRATHELTANSLRLRVDGTITPILTRTRRLDLQAGAVQEIFEYDDLTAGYFGFALTDPAPGQAFTLRMNSATLDAINPSVRLDGDVVFVLLSDGTVQLGSRLETPQGDILLQVNGVTVAGVSGAALAAPLGTLRVESVTGGGTLAVPLLADAATFSALAQGGNLAFRFVNGTVVNADDVRLFSGSGILSLQSAAGNLEIAALAQIIHGGTGELNLQTDTGNLTNRNLDTTQPALVGGGEIRLVLEQGLTVVGGTHMPVSAPRFSASIGTGNLRLRFMASAQVASRSAFIRAGGIGNINLIVQNGNFTFANNSTLENRGSGNLVVNVLAGTFVMLQSNNVIGTTGVVDLRARDLMQLGLVRSLGTATRLESVLGDIRAASGTSFNFQAATAAAHTPEIFASAGRVVQLNLDIANARLNGDLLFRGVNPLLVINQTI